MITSPTIADATHDADSPVNHWLSAKQSVCGNSMSALRPISKIADSRDSICKTYAVPDASYIHGTDPVEQKRLTELNRLTNASFIQFLDLSSDSNVLEVGSGLGLL